MGNGCASCFGAVADREFHERLQKIVQQRKGVISRAPKQQGQTPEAEAFLMMSRPTQVARQDAMIKLQQLRLYVISVWLPPHVS
jgi:hypothetical protein